ncbi:T4 family baseplate hub assembly chaperone [Nostoc sp.]|uniref:T4 family baseplate hub assembly chaperone n=1 Tax=Nostoc sp. TaxID=1180 RepID=UPI002FF82BE5
MRWNDQVFYLAVSGLAVNLRQLTGVEDLLLLEAPSLDTRLALALLTKIAQVADGSEVAWDTLSIADLDTLLLKTRQAVFGDRLRADATCPGRNCGAPIEVSFQVSEYLANYLPGKARGTEATEESGWFRFRDIPVSFRLPTGADQVAIAYHSHPKQQLIERCVRPADIPAKQLRRVEKAMETLAPNLAQNLQGKCSECGAFVEIYFDPQQFTLRELRNQSAFIYEDIHLLAMYYQWSETSILALPRQRRMQYAEKLRQTRRSA